MGYNRNDKTYIILFFVLFSVIVFMDSASAMTAVVNVPEKYSEVGAGEAVYFETSIKWPENTGRKDLRIEYSVQDKEGKEIAYLKVLKAIETQASFIESINIPKSTSPGIYYLFLKITDYSDLDQEVGVSFKVGKPPEQKIFSFLWIIVLILGVVTIAVLIQLFFSFRKMGNK